MSLADRVRAFLNPSSVKVNPAYQGLISYSDDPKPVQMPDNYKSYAKEGYCGNDTVYKCISYIARNGATITPVLYTDATMKKKIDKHPLLDKLNQPNKEQSGTTYREACIAYKLLSGNNYQYAVRAQNGPPDELWVLRPDLVQVIPSKTRGIVGYKYEYMDKPILPENICHTRYFHPDDDYYGLSPIKVAAITIDQQKAARTWNLALLQNSARPPGAWVIPTPLSLNDRRRLEDNLKAKLAGYKNAGTIPVLDAGLDFKSLGLPPAQLDYLPGMQYNSTQIANILNIAPQLIGDNGASTYNNLLEAKAASYTEAIFPELDDFYSCLNMWLLPMYGLQGAFLYYDKESVEVVQQTIQAQKDAQANRANEMWNSGQCTLNEARLLSGLPEVEYGDIYKFGAVIVLASDMDKYAEQSLTTPAAPPVPQAEPIQAQPGQNNQQDEAAKKALVMIAQAILEHKEMDKYGIYQPNDLQKQLKALKDQGVEYIIWDCSDDPCETCQMNDGQTVKVGDAFYSGHILPGAHPHCNCGVRPAVTPAKGVSHDPMSIARFQIHEATGAPVSSGYDGLQTYKKRNAEEYRRFVASNLYGQEVK